MNTRINADRQRELNYVLHKAALEGDVPGLCSALEHGAQIESLDGLHGCTALYNAAKHGRHGAVIALLDAGADARAHSAGGQTALHITVIREQDAVTKYPSVEALDYADIIKALIVVGADPQAENPNGKTPIQYARSTVAEYMQAVVDGTQARPIPESVGLDMGKRQAALEAIATQGKYARAEMERERQRRAALEQGEGI